MKKKPAKEIIRELIQEELKPLKADIKELKKQVGYWICGEEGGIFFHFTTNKPAKPEFSITEKVDAILDHLGMEMKKVERDEQIKVVPKKKYKKGEIVYRARGITKEKK